MFTARHEPPEHLLNLFWLDQQETAALGVLRDLEKVRLAKGKLKPGGVHASRVALRRWYSIWEILSADGWEDEFYKRKIEDRLKKVNKALGELRDLDVNLELGRSYSLPEAVLKRWSKRRKKLTGKVRDKIALLKPKKILAAMKMHLGKRYFELDATYRKSEKSPKSAPVLNSSVEVMETTASFAMERSASGAEGESAFEHTGRLLEMTEKSARLLAMEARTDEELHELRLFIKRWRYILTEFFGLTTLELVKAQQLLGKHHDLTRLLIHLNIEAEKLYPKYSKSSDFEASVDQAKSRISLELARVFDEIKPVLAALPYGLRPHTSKFTNNDK